MTARPEWAAVATSATLLAAAERLRSITERLDSAPAFPEYFTAALVDLPRAGFRSRVAADAAAGLLEAVAAGASLPSVEAAALELALGILMPFVDEAAL